jgi:hypothetical protein
MTFTQLVNKFPAIYEIQRFDWDEKDDEERCVGKDL